MAIFTHLIVLLIVTRKPIKKLGAFCWLALAIAIVETLICIKFGRGTTTTFCLNFHSFQKRSVVRVCQLIGPRGPFWASGCHIEGSKITS
jgi:hypothetical protein